jgi:hypothetical protein
MSNYTTTLLAAHEAGIWPAIIRIPAHLSEDISVGSSELLVGKFHPGDSRFFSEANIALSNHLGHVVRVEPGSTEIHVLDTRSNIVEKPPTSPAGRKFDSAKPDPTLLPPRALLSVVRVLTKGAEKYDRDNWQIVPGARTRYLAAALRHVLAYMSGEKIDPELGENHLACAACSLLFLLGFDEGDAPEPPTAPTKVKP